MHLMLFHVKLWAGSTSYVVGKMFSGLIRQMRTNESTNRLGLSTNWKWEIRRQVGEESLEYGLPYAEVSSV